MLDLLILDLNVFGINSVYKFKCGAVHQGPFNITDVLGKDVGMVGLYEHRDKESGHLKAKQRNSKKTYIQSDTVKTSIPFV